MSHAPPRPRLRAVPSPAQVPAAPSVSAHDATSTRSALPDYVELHCLSNFSFQRGASHAWELFQRAARHGYRALAITDECTLAGVVRAWQAAKDTGLTLIVGSELQIEHGPKLVLLAETLHGYQQLCRLITLARRRADKGTYRALREDFDGDLHGLLCLWLPRDHCEDAPDGAWLQARFAQRLWLAVELLRGPDDDALLHARLQLAQRLQLPAVACGDVHMHARGRRALQDTLTAIRQRLPLSEAGAHLFANGERHLRPRATLATLYPHALLAESVRIAQRCTFDLGQLRYQYPHELVPPGQTPTQWLRTLTERGVIERWGEAGAPEKARRLIEHELGVIQRLGYESYFLTVYDLVRFARSRHILCQGRGSAANSAVCYALGITAIDPDRIGMLFERFISEERKERPDIDIDFEHDRREEVIQYIFSHYGRGRAALAAVAITYHARSAVRDVARALGLPSDTVDALSAALGQRDPVESPQELLRERGFDPDTPLMRRLLVLTGELIGFPRHLSQHPGGFVISEHPLHTLVPVENATMAERTVIQWDKDDLELVGLMKVDVLALGMLSALRRTLDLLRAHRGRDLDLASIPAEDEQTYQMIQRADTIGVFQIESRAQMAMLPRLKPREFYDLVIQVAIVRPGPIQGGMVHPYLRRRSGEEIPDELPEELRDVFKRTLGVPLFQEQVMQLAVNAAGYTPGEADQLRRSMAAWKRHGGLEPHREKLMKGMLERNYSAEFATRIFEQIKGFGSYGFPESHAASFALLTYASCWLKRHEPAAFTCALINSWPMGFYSPDQLLQDARRHDLQVRPVDVRYSDWDCGLETYSADPTVQPAIRLGLRMVRGLAEDAALRLQQARAQAPFRDLADLCHRAALDDKARDSLADAGALKPLAGHRHRARWAVAGIEAQRPLFETLEATPEQQVALPLPSLGEDIRADYATIGTTLGKHPMSLLRRQLAARRYRHSGELRALPHASAVAVAGLVTMRQRPQTASGVTFLTLEDEHGLVNVVVWRRLADRQRQALIESKLLAVRGRLETADGVRHLIAGHLEDLTPLLQGLDARSRDFH
ncbi:error-prone DNA polymerase [Xanthomonas sp. NCPPB 2654]|uniref:error-prone DNA polymerase n=1 Tax=unclassified Xanthomonas TaxID=2643310 RepID=UPI0021E06C81|nr:MULTISPECIES: error-prone DNA polymerase [unclassified Xanthomonas]MDL5366496.1 error-prone DNA polymerase [Xanthomonas sp. NCPPB 2654]UYC21881.1 error-prone DNA polymerase [Xanthomonas sp. CFBP 8443]